MPALWQNVVVGLIVSAAAAYLAWRSIAWAWRKKSGGCASGCGSCPATKPPLEVVELQLTSPPSKR